MTNQSNSRPRFRVAAALIVALIFLAIGLLFAILLTEQQAQRVRVIDTTEKRVLQLASAVASRMNVAMRNMDFVLRTLGHDHGNGANANKSFAESLLSAFPPSTSLVYTLTDIDGKPILQYAAGQASSTIARKTPAPIPVDAQNRLSVGKPVRVAETGDFRLTLSRPVLRGVEVFRISSLSVSTTYIAELLSSIELRPNDVVGLFDGEGSLIAHNQRFNGFAGKTSPPPFMAAEAAAKGNYRDPTAETGLDRFYAWQRLSEVPLTIVLGLDAASILEPLDEAFARQRWIAAAVSFALLALGALILWLLARLAHRQHEIAASETRFRSLTKLSTDGYWEQDAQHRFTMIEGSLPATSGIGESHNLGKTRWELPALNMSHLDWAKHQAMLDARVPFHDLELRRADQNGRTPWVSISGEPMFDTQGQFTGYRGIARDISDHKRNEALLEGQKRVLEMILMNAPLDEILGTLVGIIEHQSPGMLGSVLLLDADGQHLRHGAAPSLPAEYNHAIDGIAIGARVGSCGTAAFTGKPVIVADIATDPLWASFRDLALAHGLRACWSTPILDAQGKVLGTFAMYFREPTLPTAQQKNLIDIATHTAAIGIAKHGNDAALRESEARFRSLTNLSSDWYWEQDKQYRMSFLSETFAQRSGTRPEKVLGKTRWDDLARTPVEGSWENHRATLEAHRPFKNFEYVRSGDDGNPYYASLSGEPVFDAQGDFAGYRGVGTNITERKMAEEQQKRLEAQLNQAQKMEALGTLSGGIAHDFNNILAAILGNVELARLEADPGDAVQESLGEIEKASQHARDLVRQILTFSRAQPQAIRVAQLEEILQDAIKMLRAT
ncbi:MAG: PAS domain S-box protein, partial [Burkholderiales bacterium]